MSAEWSGLVHSRLSSWPRVLDALRSAAERGSHDALLRAIVTAACEVAGARSGALVVHGLDGAPDRVVHAGSGVAAPGPDDTHLHLPILVRGRVAGRLDLVPGGTGRFTAEDEDLAGVLAFAAGQAVANAESIRQAERQQRWLRASAEVGLSLLSTGVDPIPVLAARAFDVAEADLVTIGLLTPDHREILVEVALGDGADDLVAQRFPVVDATATLVIERQGAVVVDASGAGDPAQFGTVLRAGSVLVLPLHGGAQISGVLTVTRRHGREAFTADELEMAAGFAAAASVALELAESRTAEKKLVLLEDRDRIARDLHDHVIQELFAIGLRLESVAAGLGPDHAAARKVSDRVEDIDRTIRRIRTSIFALRGPLDLHTDGLRQQIVEIASDLTPALGFPVHVSFAGPVDHTAGSDLADDITAVVREALTNVAKHARASSASVDISAGPTEVVITVEDDGVGLGDPERSSGLGNMSARAERHAGSMTAECSVGGGTLLIWKARLG